MSTLRPNKSAPLWGTALVAILACAFCLFNIYLRGPEALEGVAGFCPTNGCALYEDFTVFGISLWFIGAVYFLLLFFFCLKGSRGIILFLSLIGLILDSALLLLLLFTSPCLSCLLTALAFGLIYLGTRRAPPEHAPVPLRPGWLFIVWAMLFAANIFSALEESFGSWIIHGPEKAEIKLYFSPSCPACVEALYGLANNPRVAFLPVAKNDSDKETIFRLYLELQHGDDFAEAFNKAQNSILPAKLGFPEKTWFSFMLYRNRAASMRIGNKTLPLLIVNDIPALLAHPKTPTHKNAPAEAKPEPDNLNLESEHPSEIEALPSSHSEARSPTSHNSPASASRIPSLSDDLNNLFHDQGLGNCPDSATAPCPEPPRRRN